MDVMVFLYILFVLVNVVVPCGCCVVTGMCNIANGCYGISICFGCIG